MNQIEKILHDLVYHSVYLMIWIILFSPLYLIPWYHTDYHVETEAGYLINKTSSDSFYYEIIDDIAEPNFKQEFYYTVLVDDNYVKIMIPYEVYMSYQLGDHITVYRDKTIFGYKNYKLYIEEIEVPGVIVNEEYR